MIELLHVSEPRAYPAQNFELQRVVPLPHKRTCCSHLRKPVNFALFVANCDTWLILLG